MQWHVESAGRAAQETNDDMLMGGHLCHRGLPYMTSAVGGGGGSPKSRRKEQNQLICE